MIPVKTKVLVTLKGQDARASLLDGLPRERHWGLPLLQERPELKVDPCFIPATPVSRWQRLGRRLRPRSSRFGLVPPRDLVKRLAEIEKRYDVVLSISQLATQALLELKHRKLLQSRLVCLVIGLADRLEHANRSRTARTIERYAGADQLLVMSTAELDLLQSVGLKQAHLIPFGVDVDFWSPSSAPVGDYVFAVGSDPCRDFDTLVESCPYPLKLMTRSRSLVSAPVSKHVAFVQGDTFDLRRLYAEARLVVVPLKDCRQPSGQTTVLQAMAMGKAVVLTRTRGLWSDLLIHDENCLFVPPGDSNALRRELTRAYTDRSFAEILGWRARKVVEACYRVEQFADALAVIAAFGHLRGARS